MPTSPRRSAAKRKPAEVRTTSFKLSAEDDAFIREQVRHGRAVNASQVIRAAMREYRESSELRLALRATLEARLHSKPLQRSVDAVFDEIEAEVFGAEK